ncbi:MAG: hypothetical protein A2Y62_15000 [Candidatus Fischerbacteria bacterium RBG_13_37_8]|uniref:MPN domain-containing protein n=1 Tax=Candidatus Fischerbacteria bacterium RBG_13_37_8 TaxID=1817863 RepID=A0A1F5V4Q9_9BACT|nr:MAG: hypothetical protein A2Y62_15000 [Candidatus Fischerbacteria bacterium RBG_13_37_8]
MKTEATKYTLKDLPSQQRPREKLLSAGAESLNDAELLAIIIQNGTIKQTALELSYALLTRFGSLHALKHVGIAELRSISGIGFAKACQIKASIELSRRFYSFLPAPAQSVCCAEDAYHLMKHKFLLEKKEFFYILLLDIKNKLLKACMISQGTLTSSLVHPREVFNPAIKESAASIILIHNHPSGDPKPSLEDVEITRQIKQAGFIIGIKVLDHVIIGNNAYFSFAEQMIE